MDNTYTWSTGADEPNGTAFTDFLDKLNDPTFGVAATFSDVTGCFAGHCDWRLPNIVELQTLRGPVGDCPSGTSIDSVFGPTAIGVAVGYYSAPTADSNPTAAWYTESECQIGWVSVNGKQVDYSGRAVRAGSCN